ncbi:MAG TPA: LuxR C-terminal-related transcriptional regulator [Anaerolineales bacterium]
MQGTDPLIHTKLRSPSARAGRVLRPRLQEQILRGLRGPLTLVIAPAGFGKTVLVASCLPECKASVAWLSLEKDDNQEGRFLRYLTSALHEAAVQVGTEAAEMLAGSMQASPQAVLTSLINDLDAVGRDLVLVLDDYQFISSQAVHEQLTFLLEHRPACLHLAIASRSDPPLPLARLRARGQTVELRAADLSFSAPEAAEFLNVVMGLHLDAESIATLQGRTEGWIAGLQMAALSMRNRDDVAGFIDAFSGTNRYILDYLLEEVLAGQPPEVQNFLLRTSILDRLSARLCDALLAGDEAAGGSLEVLEYLERANIFLLPVDEDRVWYRYHHLFADLLRTQLQRSVASEEAARLHRRAAAWHEQYGSIQQAIQHASMASDDAMVERLVEHSYVDLLNRGEMSAVRFWAGRLSRDLVHSRPRLCLYEAFSHSWFGELDQADRLLDAAEKRIRRPGTPADGSLLGFLAYIQSRVTAMRGDLPRAIELALIAREQLPSANLALKLDMGITLGFLYFLHGDAGPAAEFLEQTIRSGKSIGAVLNPVAAACVLARLYAYCGQLHRSHDLYLQASDWIQGDGGKHLGASSLVDVGVADVLCEWNDLDRALALVERGLASIPQWGKPDDLILPQLTLARIHQARGDMEATLQAVEQAKRIAAACGIFPEAAHALELAQARLWLGQGDLLAARRWAEARERDFGTDPPFRIEDEAVHLAGARVLTALDSPDQALWILEHMEETALPAGRMGRVIEISMLRALALQKKGDSGQALLALERSLELAGPEGYMRIFLDEGTPIRKLLMQSHARSGPASIQEYAGRLLSAFDQESRDASAMEGAAQSGQLIEQLSPRELEVLRLMALGCSNDEIAGQLFVARGTVKAHSASIYRKLDAANRTQAVARARQLRILS